MKHFLFALALTALFAPFFSVQAQTPCGSIIAPEDIYKPTENIVSTPIDDCDNPFDSNSANHTKYTLKIDDLTVPHNGSIEVASGGTTNFAFTGTYGGYVEITPRLFVHEVSDYRFFDMNPTEIGDTDYIRFGLEFGLTESEVELYLKVLHGEYSRYDLTDSQLEEYFNFRDYAEDTFIPSYPTLQAGTYTLVTTESLLLPTQNSLFQRLFAYIIPVVHAQEPGEGVYTFAFTITEPQPEPQGASSVLFLPGIQASRLYTDGILGTENQIWEPNANADVEKLEMTEIGESVNEVYTRDVIDELAVPALGTNVYKSFLNFLADLKNDKIIKEYNAFAYDWRFDVIDIAQNGTQFENEIKSLVAEVERLAATSSTDKVTIIGHSNGGLLGKALISELVEQNKQELVDKLVMVGTPQLGTPKAIGVMLHGLGQIAGIGGNIVNPETARDVIRNMPGTYALLPSAEYFAKNDDVLVTSDTSNTTASVRTYGDITTQQQLNNYLLDTQDVRVDDVPLYEPSTLNTAMLQQSLATKLALDTWLPPENIDVYEVVGTGNPTIKGFKYESFPCYVGGVLICNTGVHMDAVPQISDNGDETVMALSAGGQDGVKLQGVVDLYEEGLGVLNITYSHFDLTESPTVQSFLDSIIKYPYISDTLVAPEFVNVSRTYKIIGVHSPVLLSITDTTGKQTGVVNGEIKEDIDGSQYMELGESKYIIVPNDLPFTANIKGEALGVYSLTVDLVENNIQSQVHRYLGASTTATMQASFTLANNTFSNIITDLNGDNATDVTATLDGQIIPPPVVYSYALLKTSIKALKLQRFLEAVLIVQVDTASYWDALLPHKPQYQKFEYGALDTLKATLKIYKQRKLITQEQYTSLEVIINYLRN